MEMDLYNPDVTFNDPMISFEGVDKYRNNVDMLAGVTMLGKLCFSDPGLAMHSVSELPDGRLQTRWTLQFRFKLLPWAPVARFTGVSRYTLDAQCRVLAQEDFWDSVNMLPGGEYAEKPKTAGLLDLLAQLAPSGGNAAQQASGKELPYVLLRRAAAKVGVAGYEVRRYPQHVSVATDYYRRLDAFGTLGAYTNGANDLQSELTPYVPSLMSVPPDERTLEQIADDSLDLKPAERPKEMRWPMAVPAMKDANPPKPNERLQDVTRLEVMPARTVAVLAFSEPTTEPNVRGFHELLKSYLKEDGLVPMAATEDEQFRLAQVRHIRPHSRLPFASCSCNRLSPPHLSSVVLAFCAVRRAQLIWRAPLRDLDRPRRASLEVDSQSVHESGLERRHTTSGGAGGAADGSGTRLPGLACPRSSAQWPVPTVSRCQIIEKRNP